ncbi:MAG: hypothetical protein ACYDC3_06930 [Candidatus Binataceae bacterium]
MAAMAGLIWSKPTADGFPTADGAALGFQRQLGTRVSEAASFLWDTDYPHPDGTFPWGLGAIMKQPISDSSRRKILWDNAARAFALK